MTQDEALAILISGASAFLTGAPGSGKSYVTQRFIEWLRNERIPVAVTASTGIASTLLDGGGTIHAWCGIGVDGDSLTCSKLEALTRWPNVIDRVSAARILVERPHASSHRSDLSNRPAQ